jgi:nitroreductase
MNVKSIDLKSVDHVLNTTRAVRKRLDLSRPIDPAILQECIEVALQAPTGLIGQTWHFLAITDAEKRARLADLYRRDVAPYNEGREVPDDIYRWWRKCRQTPSVNASWHECSKPHCT